MFFSIFISTASNVKARHELLEAAIGTFQQEKDAMRCLLKMYMSKLENSTHCTSQPENKVLPNQFTFPCWLELAAEFLKHVSTSHFSFLACKVKLVFVSL